MTKRLRQLGGASADTERRPVCFPVCGDLWPPCGLGGIRTPPAHEARLGPCAPDVRKRKLHQCLQRKEPLTNWPSYKTIGKAVGMSENTVRKHVCSLVDKGLIHTENTTVMTRDGLKRNGNLLYTIPPFQPIVDEYYRQQLEQIKRDDCIAPKVQKVEMKTLRPEHLKSYLDAADARGVLPMFYLELVSGLRKGELVALLWDDLDIQNRTISVSKQYIKNPSGRLTLSRPKTETSVRRVSIPQEAVDLLIQEHEKHPENPYMFPSPISGEMYYPDSVVKLHEKILKDAGLEHIRFHDLRHTFATLALQNGVDIKTVSSMLGHYDAGFTLRTYTHATRQMQDQAAETMGNFMAQVM